MAGIVCDDLECILFEGNIISEVWSEGRLLYQYDSTAPALTVAAPTGTAGGAPTYYTSGTTYRVQGTVSDAESGVAAVYVNDSAAVLSGNTWYKDITVAANTTATVQVYAADKAGNRTDAITRYVRYDSAAPSLAVTAPAGTASGSPTYTTGASYTVSGTVSDASGIRSVTVNGSAASVSSGKWSKTLSLTANTTTTVTVVATDNAGRTTTVTRYVRYDSAAPSLAVTGPTGTSSSAPTYTTGASYTVSGTVSDASGIRSVTVNGSAASVSSGKWSKAISLTANTTTTVTVVATDNAGRTTTVTRYVRYDSAAPSLAVTAPTGTSSGAPTYYQSDAAVSYTVSGTVSDASGIKSVTVNGSAASVSSGKWTKALSLATNTTHTITVVATDNAGRTATVTRYIRVEAYYNYAARIAGTTPQASLDATLRNSTVCQAIAGNSTARSTMNSRYLSTIVSYIQNEFYWNAGLNYLSYVLGKRFYVYHKGNTCDIISGGWNLWNASNTANGLSLNSDNANGYTQNTFSVTQFRRAYMTVTVCTGAEIKFGPIAGGGGYSYMHVQPTSSTGNVTCDWNHLSVTGTRNIQVSRHGGSAAVISKIWFEP